MTRSIVRAVDTAAGLTSLLRRTAKLVAQRDARLLLKAPTASSIRSHSCDPAVSESRVYTEPTSGHATASPSRSFGSDASRSSLSGEIDTASSGTFAQGEETDGSEKAKAKAKAGGVVASSGPAATGEVSESQAPLSHHNEASPPQKLLQASRVPSSRFARLLQYSNLAAGLGVGAASATIQNLTTGKKSGKVVFSQANINRMVRTLSKMRGAALKLGQFLSIQESKLLPPELELVLSRMQNAADYMPEWQTRRVLAAELGPDWESQFATFDMVPFASASIGQVHNASTKDGQPVAVKVQFPGVAESIESDVANLASILTFSAVLPKGLFLDNTLRVMKGELMDECDYVREAEFCRLFGTYLEHDPIFAVPKVYDHLSTGRVFTSEFMQGVPLKQVADLSQDTRDRIGSALIQLCLRELFEFKTMQTDPNWSNFLWDSDTRKLALIDFGATRTYDDAFISCYKDLLVSAVKEQRHECEVLSRQLGYLTPDDNQEMIAAHIESMLALAEPFRTRGLYAFADEQVTSKVRKNIPIMLRSRQTPPPYQTYSLNRKLSGCFLLCARLKSRVDCRSILDASLTV